KIAGVVGPLAHRGLFRRRLFVSRRRIGFLRGRFGERISVICLRGRGRRRGCFIGRGGICFRHISRGFAGLGEGICVVRFRGRLFRSRSLRRAGIGRRLRRCGSRFGKRILRVWLWRRLGRFFRRLLYGFL